MKQLIFIVITLFLTACTGVDKADKIEFLTGDPESSAYAARVQEVLLA